MHLAIGGQHDPRHPEAGLTDGAAAALEASRQEQGAAPTVALLEGAVLVVGEVVLGAHVARPAAEAEQARTAVPPRREEGATDAEERLTGGGGGDGVSTVCTGERPDLVPFVQKPADIC